MAAGNGARMGGENKMLRQVNGRSILFRSLAVLLATPALDVVVIVVSEATREEAQRALAVLRTHQQCSIVLGGQSRAESVYCGLSVAECKECSHVLIHDGARCLVTKEVIDRCLQSAWKKGSGVAGIPAIDTMKRVDKQNNVIAGVDRKEIWHMQTPQVFQKEQLMEQYKQANDWARMTDDAQLLVEAGIPVHIVLGSRENIKVTDPFDLDMAQMILEKREGKRQMKVGFGEDVHAFAKEGKPLVLAGVVIPYERNLKGHSDADVVAHAVTDALLGAMAWGDIGKWFPDTDRRYKGIDSLQLLSKVVEQLQEAEQEIIHVDVTIIAQEPKITPYREEMRASLASVLHIAMNRISIKATTTEGLGFEGEKKGITTRAVVTMEGKELTDECEMA